MYTKLSFLILSLSLSYYELLNSPILVEATNLPSNGQTLTIDLIHRSSQPNSNYQKRSILGSISYNQHFHLSTKHFGHSTSTISTKVIPNGGDYLMNIAIGSPPIELTGVADTGSDLVWVQCAPCHQCFRQAEPLFNPKRSVSYKTIPCNSQSCNYTDFESTCIPNNGRNYGSCVYRAGYGDGTSSIGVLANDKFTFKSDHDRHSVASPSITFGCGFNQEGDVGSNGDGIIGLGTGNLSLVSQLGSTISHKFTYCLTPPSSGVNGKLKLGPNKMRPRSVSTPMVNLGNIGLYILRLEKISIGKSSIKVGDYMIIDSGTTLTYLESSVYDSVKNATMNAIGLKPVPDPNQIFEPCYKAEQTMVGFNPPDIVLHFKDAHVVLKSINTFRTLDNVTCLAVLPTQGVFVFGNIAQVNFEVEYDLDAKKISFAPTDCTKY